MPHSSGGGFHGGGFHGGGFSGHHYGRGGSHNGPIISRHYFAGSTAWLYYTSRGVPHIVYSTADIANLPKGANAFAYIILGIFAIAPLGMIVASGINHPAPLQSLDITGSTITDNAGVLTPSEQGELMSVFAEFRKVSGVVPAVYTVNNGKWGAPMFWHEIFPNDKYTLEDYAYSTYIGSFKDENHWLIVYACDKGTTKGNWAFEGMQGNNTDTILFGNVTDRFNHHLGYCLDSDKSVGESLIDSFNLILPDLLKTSFYIDPEMLTFTIIWELMVGFMITATIVSQIKMSDYANARKIENPTSIVMTKCKHCGASYYKGTVERCPKCSRSVVMDDELDGKF